MRLRTAKVPRVRGEMHRSLDVLAWGEVSAQALGILPKGCCQTTSPRRLAAQVKTAGPRAGAAAGSSGELGNQGAPDREKLPPNCIPAPPADALRMLRGLRPPLGDSASLFPFFKS